VARYARKMQGAGAAFHRRKANSGSVALPTTVSAVAHFESSR
jgi:hypothetical protein